MAESGLNHWADILIIAVYFAFVLCVGLWSILKKNRGNVEGYFLASRTMPWFAVGASIFGSNIGSEHFVGLAGAGASSGIVLGLFEWIPAIVLQTLSWFFLPVFISAGVYTLPEYMEKRFGGNKIRIYLSVLALFIHILSRLSIAIFAGAVYIQFALKWNMYPAIIGLLILTSVFTMFGGLSAVMYTDTAQSVIIIVGSFVVMGAGLNKIGGYSNLESRYQLAIPSNHDANSTCGLPRQDAFHVLRGSDSDFPWPSMLLQCGIASAWYWVCDQIMVQRCLAAKDMSHAKGGTLLGGSLKILPMFTMIVPGMIARILYPDEVACVDPDICKQVCDNPAGCSNIAYPKLVFELLPNGARGLLMAVMLSAIVTSLTSIFNSSSTVFTMDIWRKLRPHANQKELLIVGRGYIILLCLVTILWIPVVKAAQGGQLFTYLVVVEGFIAAPLPILFGLAIFWERTTEKGALYGIVITHAIGIARLILEVIFPVPACGEVDSRPDFLSKVHSFYYSEMLMFIQFILTVSISLCTKGRTPEQLQGTTWNRRLNPDNNADYDKTNNRNVVDEEYTMTLQETPEINSQNSDDDDGVLDQETRQRSRLYRLCSKMFGLSAKSTEQNIDISVASRLTFLREPNKTVKTATNTLAILLIATIAFLVGYYK